MRTGFVAKILGVTAAAAMATTMLPATEASAINRVYSGCTSSSDYLRVYNSGLLCFANAGTASVAIYSVYQVASGNNAAYVTDTSFGAGYVGKWGYIYWSPSVTVSRIQIL